MGGYLKFILIACGTAVKRLVAVEADRDLARLMRRRFPQLHVVEGDAFDLGRALPAADSGPLARVWVYRRG